MFTFQKFDSLNKRVWGGGGGGVREGGGPGARPHPYSNVLRDNSWVPTLDIRHVRLCCESKLQFKQLPTATSLLLQEQLQTFC